ncbi:MAG: DsbA family protein [Actinomycetota bacterium]
MIELAVGTIVVFSDIACAWAHVAVHRLHRTRARLGLQERAMLDLRAFPLEVFNERATPKLVLDAEIPVAGALEPQAGWQMWQRDAHDYPVTTLLALEAVQAAKDQGFEAAEKLDRALRVALFGQSRNISMRHEILDVASRCEGLDLDALEKRLDDGVARRTVLDQCAQARSEVKGSPHVFLPDGSNEHNPGVKLHWEGTHGRGFPYVDRDDPRALRGPAAARRRLGERRWNRESCATMPGPTQRPCRGGTCGARRPTSPARRRGRHRL